MPAEALLAILAVLAIFAVAPILSIVAMVRVRNLERRFDALAQQIDRLEGHLAKPAATERPATSNAPQLTAAAAATSPAVAGPIPVSATAAATPPVPAAQAPPPPPAPKIAPPAAPGPRAADWGSDIAGRWLNRLGLLAVGIGVSYFLKYAIDNDWIGPRGQVAIGALLGAALVASGPSLRRRGYDYFGDGLTGLGASVLYLSFWAGGSYYHLFSQDVAFVAMIAVTAAMLAIAVGRRSQPIAAVALIGGFLTPVLVSTGHDAEIVLFSYLLLLGLGFLPIARRQGWRFLELPAFVFTQLYFWLWFDRFFTTAKLVPTLAFTAAFFVEFAVLPVLRSRRTAALLPEHAVLILANAGVTLAACHAQLWPDHRWGLSIATLALAAVHLFAANAVPRPAGGQGPAKLLFGGAALTLLTLVIPIRLDGMWISTAWAIEAALVMWAGFRARLPYLRALAFALFVVVGVRLLSFPEPAGHSILNARFLTEIVTIVCAAAALDIARRNRDLIGDEEGKAFLGLGIATNVLAIGALTDEVHVYFQPQIVHGVILEGAVDARLAESLAISILWALYASALMIAGVRRTGAAFRWQGLILFGLTTVKVFFIDLAFLSGFYRIASSIALGVVLLIVSFLYQRTLAAGRRGDES